MCNVVDTSLFDGKGIYCAIILAISQTPYCWHVSLTKAYLCDCELTTMAHSERSAKASHFKLFYLPSSNDMGFLQKQTLRLKAVLQSALLSATEQPYSRKVWKTHNNKYKQIAILLTPLFLVSQTFASTMHSTSEDTLSLWWESHASANPIITLKALYKLPQVQITSVCDRNSDCQLTLRHYPNVIRWLLKALLLPQIRFLQNSCYGCASRSIRTHTFCTE